MYLWFAKIELFYVDQRGHPTERPLALIFFGPVWLLVSWCEARKDCRSFRLDRVANLEVSSETFKDEKDKNPDAYTSCMYDLQGISVRFCNLSIISH